MPDMSNTAWIEACEKLDWRVSVSEDEIELEKHSPAGEDFIFSITDLSNIPALCGSMPMDLIRTST